MVQTVLLWGVDSRLENALSGRNFPDEPAYVVCKDLLYADDTVLFSSCSAKLQMHLDLLVEEGQRYGLELNCDKNRPNECEA